MGREVLVGGFASASVQSSQCGEKEAEQEGDRVFHLRRHCLPCSADSDSLGADSLAFEMEEVVGVHEKLSQLVRLLWLCSARDSF